MPAKRKRANSNENAATQSHYPIGLRNKSIVQSDAAKSPPAPRVKKVEFSELRSTPLANNTSLNSDFSAAAKTPESAFKLQMPSFDSAQDQLFIDEVFQSLPPMFSQYIEEEQKAARCVWQWTIGCISQRRSLEQITRSLLTLETSTVPSPEIEWEYVSKEQLAAEEEEAGGSGGVKHEIAPDGTVVEHDVGGSPGGGGEQEGPSTQTFHFVCKVTKRYVIGVDLPPHEMVPRMVDWVTTEENFSACDETILRNVPYVGDNFNENCDFIEELLDKFSGNLAAFSEVQFIPDDLFYRAVQRIWDIYDSLYGTRTKQPLSSPPHTVFAALGNFFNCGDLDNIQEKYNQLTDDCDVVPNPTGPAARGTEFSADAFEELFCRRCFLFDCGMHVPLRPDRHSVPPRSNLAPCRSPCGPHCYMMTHPCLYSAASPAAAGETVRFLGRPDQLTVSSGEDKENRGDQTDTENQGDQGDGDDRENTIPKSSMSSDVASNSSAEETKQHFFSADEVWSGRDAGLLGLLLPAYGRDICTLAEALTPLTCRQVYAKVTGGERGGLHWLLLPPPVESAARRGATGGGSDTHGKKKKPAISDVQRMQRIMWKQQSSGQGPVQYYPCGHREGEDSTHVCNARCICIQRNTFCDKFCACGPACHNRFSGCSCKTGCRANRGSCPCVMAGRECDPDLCTRCGAGGHFPPTRILTPNSPGCHNIQLQLGFKHPLYTARSKLAGWGVFSKIPIRPGEFIAEYTGEVITHDEAERRGKIYDKINSNFLFNLNNDYVVDATRKGNTMRFLNHSSTPNCVARILYAQGEHRIAIFAGDSVIEPGTELLYNYSYTDNFAVVIAQEDHERAQEEPAENPPEPKPPGRPKKTARKKNPKRVSKQPVVETVTEESEIHEEKNDDAEKTDNRLLNVESERLETESTMETDE